MQRSPGQIPLLAIAPHLIGRHPASVAASRFGTNPEELEIFEQEYPRRHEVLLEGPRPAVNWLEIFAPVVVVAVVFAVQCAELSFGAIRLEGNFDAAEAVDTFAGTGREETLRR